jgi:hypothetical protein
MNHRRSLFCLLATLALTAGACAEGSGNNQNNTNGGCTDENDCRPGYDCVGGECVLPSDGGVDGGEDGHPVIQVDPLTLVFDEAVIGAPQTLSATVTNIGDGNLELTDIRLEENDPEVEFSLETPEYTTLGPGDSIQLGITLSPTDTLLDTGALIIESNDVVSPTVTVDLSSAFIGSPDLQVCVVTGQAPPNDCADPLVMDFGTVAYAASAQKEVTLTNIGTGNKVITVEDVVVSTTTPSHDPLYQIELFQMVENPPGSGNWEESPATLPVDLAPTTGQEPDPLALHARVIFTANTDGFLILTGDQLVVTTTDTDNPTPADTTIPLTASIDGCPPGMHDLNGNPTDGCEYACSVTNGGVEACDGVDNDCDGTVDGISEPCYDAGDGGCDPDGSNCRGICSPGTQTCNNGSWSSCQGQTAGQPEQCNGLDDDCDGVVNNGLDEGGDACGPSTSLTQSDLADSGTSASISGTITTGDEDWYQVTFVDNHSASSADTFNVNITFSDPPGGGNFRMDILKDGCSAPPTCASGTNVGITAFEWNAAGDDPGGGNTCASGANPCVDNSMTLYIKVYKTGGPDCESYTLSLSNG